MSKGSRKINRILAAMSATSSRKVHSIFDFFKECHKRNDSHQHSDISKEEMEELAIKYYLKDGELPEIKKGPRKGPRYVKD